MFVASKEFEVVLNRMLSNGANPDRAVNQNAQRVQIKVQIDFAPKSFQPLYSKVLFPAECRNDEHEGNHAAKRPTRHRR